MEDTLALDLSIDTIVSSVEMVGGSFSPRWTEAPPAILGSIIAADTLLLVFTHS